jgi:thiol-disulfide isomerase/thioredoxin
MNIYRIAPFLFAAGVILTPSLFAQSTAAPTAPPPFGQASPALEGPTIDGNTFKLSTLRGKVVLVMFWSTGCAVCRDKMPELRQNYEGWAGKPFELVLISVDNRMQDLADYEKIISRMVPLKQRFVQLWAGNAGYRDGFGKPAQLPATYLLDKSGKIVERYTGRIPAEAWDRIADLL